MKLPLVANDAHLGLRPCVFTRSVEGSAGQRRSGHPQSAPFTSPVSAWMSCPRPPESGVGNSLCALHWPVRVLGPPAAGQRLDQPALRAHPTESLSGPTTGNSSQQKASHAAVGGGAWSVDGPHWVACLSLFESRPWLPLASHHCPVSSRGPPAHFLSSNGDPSGSGCPAVVPVKVQPNGRCGGQGINGFGRIGRLVFRAASANPDVTLKAVNDPLTPQMKRLAPRCLPFPLQQMATAWSFVELFRQKRLPITGSWT